MLNKTGIFFHDCTVVRTNLPHRQYRTVQFRDLRFELKKNFLLFISLTTIDSNKLTNIKIILPMLQFSPVKLILQEHV